MENAANALLIAGGILLAILTLSLLIYAFSSASTIFNAQEKEKEAQRLSEWNAEWEAYNKQLMYGAEVLTVVNKAAQNNSEYTAGSEYKVYIEIKGKKLDKTEIVLNNEDSKPEDIEEYLKTVSTHIFKCAEMSYNDDTGRVNKVVFGYVKERIL